MSSEYSETPIVLKEEQIKKMLVVMGIDGLEKWALQVQQLHKRLIFVLKDNKYPVLIRDYIKMLRDEKGEKP